MESDQFWENHLILLICYSNLNEYTILHEYYFKKKRKKKWRSMLNGAKV